MSLWISQSYSKHSFYFFFSHPGPVFVSREVEQAISDGSAVVALESTIITHGMMYPANLE